MRFFEFLNNAQQKVLCLIFCILNECVIVKSIRYQNTQKIKNKTFWPYKKFINSSLYLTQNDPLWLLGPQLAAPTRLKINRSISRPI